MKMEDSCRGNSDSPKPMNPGSYEKPQIWRLGTLADLTQGVVPITTDGVGPGSTV
jgi:hypothetical protein